MQVGKGGGVSLYLVSGCCGRMKNQSNKAFRLSTFLPPATSEHLAHTQPSLAYNTPYTAKMGKEPVMVCQGIRYEPYSIKSSARRRRGSPPPGSRGIRAGSHRAQLTGGIFDLLDDLNTRYESSDLRKLFRAHANQPGSLGQAIETWIKYDEVTKLLTSSSFWAVQTGVLLANSLFQIRGTRKPDPTNFMKTQHNDQIHCNYVPGPIPGGENRASRPPSGQPDTHHVSFLHDRKSLVVELNSHYRFSPLVTTLSAQMSRQ